MKKANTVLSLFDTFKFKYEFLFNKKQKFSSRLTQLITLLFLIIVFSLLAYYIF